MLKKLLTETFKKKLQKKQIAKFMLDLLICCNGKKRQN